MMPMLDCRQRPVIDERTSRSARSAEVSANLSPRAVLRPMVLVSRIPDTDSDSETWLDRSAIRSWRVVAICRRMPPTLREISTKIGTSTRETRVSFQSSASIATSVAMTVVPEDTTLVTVLVTVACMDPMSPAIRDWISPVRVRV